MHVYQFHESAFEQIRCSACQGSGRKRVYQGGKHEIIKCPHCLGTGKRRYRKCFHGHVYFYDWF